MAAQIDPSDPAYHMDWVFGTATNVHYANRKEWFTTLTPFHSACIVGGGNLKVDGVGTVTLSVKKRHRNQGSRDTATLILEDVLYTPNTFCNLFGGHIIDEYDYSLGYQQVKAGLYDRATGGRVAILDRPHEVWRLRLKGQSATESVLDESAIYSFFTDWPESERARWHRLKAKMSRDQMDLASTVRAPATSASTIEADLAKMNFVNDDPRIPPYTQEEKSWLKKHFNGEFKFLRDYAFSIYKDEDRAEGRQLLRSLMECEGDEKISNASEKLRVEQNRTRKDMGPDEEDEEGDDKEQKFLREMKEHPEAHAADSCFSRKELAYIKADYGCTATFLASFGLKSYDVRDCREGRVILQQLMEDDEDEDEDEPEEENKFLRDLQEHPESHAADYHFSEDELEWIGKHYDNSSNFLIAFGLKFYDDDDCLEGKMIVRQSMEDDEDQVEQKEDAEEDDDEPGEENKFLRYLEHPESHVADYRFSEDELDWIEKHYDGSSNFLMAYGLKFYDDDDCREGKAIVQQHMRDDA